MKKGQIKKVVPKNSSSIKKNDYKKSYFNLFGLIIIILLGIIIYSNSFNCSFHFDDFHNIVDNPKIRNLSDVSAWWNFVPSRPIGNFTFALNYHFNKLDVRYWHFVNLSIHLINACLVWWLTLLVFSSSSVKDQKISRQKKYIALFTALLFVSHPLATQSVTYIVQRLASLATMFYLLSLIFYLKARLSDKGLVFKYLMFGICFLSGVLAMMTKENAYTLPFTIVLVEFFFLRKKKIVINFKDYRLYIFFAGLTGLIILILSRFSLSIFDPIPPQQGHNYTVTATNYLLTQFSVIIKYIQLLILPINQMLDYDIQISTDFFEIKTLISFILLLALFILGIFLYKKHRILSFGIFWFFLTLSVEASFIPIPNLIFEHRTYLPSFGFFLILSTSIYLLLGEKYKFLTITLLLIIIGTNSVLTHKRNNVWKDEFTRYNDNIKKAPKSARSFAGRGYLYFKQGQFDKAITDYSRALEINADYFEAYQNRSKAYMNLKEWEKAIVDYTHIIAINPRFSEAYKDRGCAYGSLELFDKAINDFNAAIKLNTKDDQTYNNRGFIYYKLGQFEKALNDYNTAIEINPKLTIAYYYRGNIYLKLEKWEKAIADYSKVLEVYPNYELALSEREYALKKLNNTLN